MTDLSLAVRFAPQREGKEREDVVPKRRELIRMKGEEIWKFIYEPKSGCPSPSCVCVSLRTRDARRSMR